MDKLLVHLFPMGKMGIDVELLAILFDSCPVMDDNHSSSLQLWLIPLF